MTTLVKFGYALLAGLGVAICFADLASAAEKPKHASAGNHGLGTISGYVADYFGDQLVYGVDETITVTPIAGGPGLSTRTDGEGRFVFQGLPPGRYDIRTQLDWTTTYVECYDDGSTARLYTDHSKRLQVTVQVKPNQTARVDTFNITGVQDGFYSYGGVLLKPHHPLVTR